jgi:hypothetical protein
MFFNASIGMPVPAAVTLASLPDMPLAMENVEASHDFVF